MNSEWWQHTKTWTGSGLIWSLALPHRQVTGQTNSSLHMTVNLWLTLLKGSACQRVRLIGNKSPIQSEFEGNMRAYAYSSTLTTCWLSAFSACQTQWGVDLSTYKQGSLFLQRNWFSMMYNEWFAVKVTGKSLSEASKKTGYISGGCL